MLMSVHLEHLEHTTMPADLTGKVFGKLTVIGYANRRGHHHYWVCRCECGREKAVSVANLNTSRSCGCARLDAIRKHGMVDTPTYTSWKSMLRRCADKDSRSYHNYGGRGISVCDRWRKFENFLAD